MSRSGHGQGESVSAIYNPLSKIEIFFVDFYFHCSDFVNTLIIRFSALKPTFYLYKFTRIGKMYCLCSMVVTTYMSSRLLEQLTTVCQACPILLLTVIQYEPVCVHFNWVVGG